MSDKWLRLAALLSVLAGLAYQVSLVFWYHFPAPESNAVTQVAPAVSNAGSNSTAENFLQQANAISQAYLFGKPEVQAAVVQQVEEAPETKLNYKLRGIYYSTVARLSSAIVEVQPNKSQHYLIDDELADNITLAKIEQDHILINRYGKLERLNLQKPKPPGGTNQAQSVRGVGSANSSAVLRAYKRRYSSNPMALATRFQAIPVQQDGRNIGFKLKPLRGESLLRKLDFEPNDVFTAVNGVSLSNPLEALDAMRALTTASRVTVTFLRNGTEQTANFEL
jgi:general secretion pathway protein C